MNSGIETPLPRQKKVLMPAEEVFAKLDEEWDFEKLIEPYREGGKPDIPVVRTWGTIIDWLINKRKFPPEIVGAGIFLVWMKIKRDGDFKGDGSYGSAGREFVQSIRVMCAQVAQARVSSNIMTGLAGKIGEKIQVAFQTDFWTMTPWFVKMWSFKYWKFALAKRRVRKEAKRNSK